MIDADLSTRRMISLDPITEEWLKSVGFRWEDVGPMKHWTLWMGGIAMFSSFEDLGVEVSQHNTQKWWFCWLRSDLSHKYSRFIHLRHIAEKHELIAIVVALSGLPWTPENHLYGAVRRPEEADYIRSTEKRLDRRVLKASPWGENDKDESKSGPMERY